MKIKYLYPFWGCESFSPSEFFNLIEENGFDGVEINIPRNDSFQKDFINTLEEKRKSNPSFVFAAQQVLGNQKETPKEYLKRVLERLEFISKFQPDFINSHTGKDHFSFSENCRIIEALEDFSASSKIPVYHEIHRGRFTFHSTNTLRYLEKFPELKFVGDFSHWCVVSESLLEDQEETIQKITPNIHHIHARIGTEQASQVNHPFAPEWKTHLNQFTKWWKEIINYHGHKKSFTITPEFGPFPYMPQTPFVQKSLSNQQEINKTMKNYLKKVLI